MLGGLVVCRRALGAIILGVSETVAYFTSTQLSAGVAYLILLLVLIIGRPACSKGGAVMAQNQNQRNRTFIDGRYAGHIRFRLGKQNRLGFLAIFVVAIACWFGYR